MTICAISRNTHPVTLCSSRPVLLLSLPLFLPYFPLTLTTSFVHLRPERISDVPLFRAITIDHKNDGVKTVVVLSLVISRNFTRIWRIVVRLDYKLYNHGEKMKKEEERLQKWQTLEHWMIAGSFETVNDKGRKRRKRQRGTNRHGFREQASNTLFPFFLPLSLSLPSPQSAHSLWMTLYQWPLLKCCAITGQREGGRAFVYGQY